MTATTNEAPASQAAGQTPASEIAETRPSSRPDHDELVANMTGGMVPASVPRFDGSERLRPDGRPRGELRQELRRINDARNAWTAITAVGLPITVIAIAILANRWWLTLLLVPVMGILQNRMFILHHEGAHRLLFSNRRLNDILGVNIFGWLAFGTGTHAYRRGHSNHHRDEFGPKEPDFLLYSFYPIARDSFRRKLRRDATGVSAYRILKPRLTGVVKRKYAVNSLRFFGGQAFVFGLFWLAGAPLLYLVLWVLPYVCVYQVLNRLRSLAEHAGMTRSKDRRETTHHIHQGWWARTILVPYGVGYHLAHHVDSGIPFRNLPRFQRVLEEDGYIDNDITWPSYVSLWRALAAG